MAFNVSYNFIAKDKFSRVSQKIQSSAAKLSRKIKDSGKAFSKAIPKIDKFKKKLSSVSKKARELGKSLLTKLTLPIAAFGAAALFQSAKLETFQVSFETMLGSAKKATKLMSDLKTFSAETPFKLDGIAKSTKTLLSFGVVQDDMINRLKMLGDISAGASVPLQDIAQIFGKAKAKSKLMTEELLQLAERGIPIIQDLSDHFGVLPADIFDAASKSQISFAVMQQSLERMTSAGGIFFEQTKKQSQTLAGLWSTFTDNIALSLAAFGDMNVEIFGLKELLKKIIAPLSKLPEKISKFTKENPKLAKMSIMFLGFLAILGPLLIFVGLLGAAIPFLITGFGALAAIVIFTFTTMSTGILALLSPIGLLVAAIAFIGFIVFKNWDAIKQKTIEIIAAMSEAFNNFKEFVSNLFDRVAERLKNAFSSIKEFIMNIFNDMVERIKNLFSGVKEFIGNIIGGIVGKIGSLLSSVSSFIGGARSRAENFFDGVDSDINQTVTSNQNLTSQVSARADVNVNLNAPRGTVDSMSTSVSGDRSAMNLGANLVTQ